PELPDLPIGNLARAPSWSFWRTWCRWGATVQRVRVIRLHHHNNLPDKMSAYILRLRRLVAADVGNSDASETTLEGRVAAVVGDAVAATIPGLQRTLDVDARDLGAALRRLGFKRERIWSGDDYALTRWRRPSAE